MKYFIWKNSNRLVFPGRKRVAAFLPVAALILLFAGCLKSSLEPLEFFEVRTEPPSAEKVGMVKLEGTLTFLDADTHMDECGFLISSDTNAVEDGSAPKWNAPLPESGETSFSLEYSMQANDPRIFFRAFARIGKRLMLAPTSVRNNYKIGDMVAIAAFVKRENDVAYVSSSTVELEQTTSKKATHHGFVYSYSNNMPELDTLKCPDCDTVDLLEIFGNRSFNATLPNLRLNTLYYLRAYAIVDSVIFYSHETISFKMKDGWKPVGKLPAGIAGWAEGGFAGVPSGRAFGGMGCQNPSGACNFSELSNDFFELKPVPLQDSIGVSNATPIPLTMVSRTNASVFSIGETVYVFFGEYTNQNTRFSLTDFWKYNPSTLAWTPIAEPPTGGPRPRTNASVFVLNDKAYIGGGEIQITNPPEPSYWTETDEVWEFDPSSNGWKRMADLPMIQSPFGPVVNYGRRKAAGFFIPDYGGYFGGGLIDYLQLKDFWHFKLPTPDNPLGSWDYVNHLPTEGEARTESVAFVVGKRGYLGMGRQLTGGDLKDLWEFNPATGTWTEKEPLPARGRALAFSFSLDNFGYIGGGVSRVGTHPESNIGIWRYEPEQ